MAWGVKFPKRKYSFIPIHPYLTQNIFFSNKKAVNHYGAAGLISRFYRIIKAGSKEFSEVKRHAWCSDLKKKITVEEWKDVCLLCHVQTINTRLKLLQYKWLMRMYITPEVLHHIYPDTPDTRVKSGTHKGSLFYCIWKCSTIQEFWKEIITILLKVTNKPLPLCPKLILWKCIWTFSRKLYTYEV